MQQLQARCLHETQSMSACSGYFQWSNATSLLLQVCAPCRQGKQAITNTQWQFETAKEPTTTEVWSANQKWGLWGYMRQWGTTNMQGFGGGEGHIGLWRDKDSQLSKETWLLAPRA